MEADTRHTVYVAVFAIVIRDGEVLLLRRHNTGYRDGQYGLPAGHLEVGENVENAVVRELFEETTLHAEPDDVEIKHVSHNRDGDEYVNFFGRVDKWHGEPRNSEPQKCDDIRWFSLNALPENTIPYVEDTLLHIEKGVVFSRWPE